MKKFLVIGNPIEHSLSPKLHNFWFKKYGFLDHVYEKKEIVEKDLINITQDIKNDVISGINITVPFKRSIIQFCDEVDKTSEITQSVNTVTKKRGKLVGHNTDCEAFKESIRSYKTDTVFILGSGGVTASIIDALHSTSKIFLSNRTKKKANDLRDQFKKERLGNIEVLEWGSKPTVICDLVINTTSVGLKDNDEIPINFNDYSGKKVLFVDLIYNQKTNFLKEAEKRGNQIMDGKEMFLRQARYAFKIWTNILPALDKDTLNLLK